MTDLSFDNLRLLNLLGAVLAVALLGFYGLWRRRRDLRLLADAHLLPHLTPPSGWARPLTHLGLVVLALALLTGALIGPRWGAATQSIFRRNLDVFVLLDVSRSMLARDIAPSRLERAKLAIRDDLLPSLGGDRIGLIAFAGVPALVCPLTSDYGFFRLALADVDPRSAPRGGTLIGDAIRKAGQLFADDQLDTHKLILLITDGEDQESFPVDAAASVWKDHKIAVIALALGDPEQGARIPLSGAGASEQFLEYEGQVVRSKSDFSTLEQVAKASDHGVFIPVGTANFDLGKIFGAVAHSIRAAEEREQRQVQQPSRAHLFAVAALALILIDSFLRDGPPGRAGRRTSRQSLEKAA